MCKSHTTCWDSWEVPYQKLGTNMPCKSPSWFPRCHVAKSGKRDRHPLAIKHGLPETLSHWNMPCLFFDGIYMDLPACNFSWNWRVHHRCSGHQNSPYFSKNEEKNMKINRSPVGYPIIQKMVSITSLIQVQLLFLGCMGFSGNIIPPNSE